MRGFGYFEAQGRSEPPLRSKTANEEGPLALTSTVNTRSGELKDMRNLTLSVVLVAGLFLPALTVRAQSTRTVTAAFKNIV